MDSIDKVLNNHNVSLSDNNRIDGVHQSEKKLDIEKSDENVTLSSVGIEKSRGDDVKNALSETLLTYEHLSGGQHAKKVYLIDYTDIIPVKPVPPPPEPDNKMD